jgi:hypothetical protein
MTSSKTFIPLEMLAVVASDSLALLERRDSGHFRVVMRFTLDFINSTMLLMLPFCRTPFRLGDGEDPRYGCIHSNSNVFDGSLRLDTY